MTTSLVWILSNRFGALIKLEMDVRMQLPTAVMPKGVLEVCIYKNLPKSKKKDSCDSNQCMSGRRTTPLVRVKVKLPLYAQARDTFAMETNRLFPLVLISIKTPFS